MALLFALRVLAAAVIPLSPTPSPTPTALPQIAHVVTSDRADETLRFTPRQRRGGGGFGRGRRQIGGILGRSDDMVVVRGVNVYPSFVEEIVRGSPEVTEYRVQLDCRSAMTQISLEAETAPDCADPATLQAHVHGELAGYKAPRTIWFVDAIGRTVSGKAYYRWARRYIAEHPEAAPSATDRM